MTSSVLETTTFIEWPSVNKLALYTAQALLASVHKERLTSGGVMLRDRPIGFGEVLGEIVT